MNLHIKKVNGKACELPIIYAYEFNQEAVEFKSKDRNESKICFIVKDYNTDGSERMIEYYYREEKPDLLWWHNVFYGGTSFEKRLKDTAEGEKFFYRKKEYYWRKLSQEEIRLLVENKLFTEEV